MIWAIELHERYSRVNCSDCLDRHKEERGCNKPGMSYGPGKSMVFKFTSPRLRKMGRPAYHVNECPIGVILRESPYIYDLLQQRPFLESGALGPTEVPKPTRIVAMIATSELDRLRELRRQQERAARTSADATAEVRRRHG